MSETIQEPEVSKEKKARRFFTYCKSIFWVALALLIFVAAVYLFVKMGFDFCWWGTPNSGVYNWGCGA